MCGLNMTAPQTTFKKDWQVLATQPSGEVFRLEPSACDPLTARFIDQSDVELYFKL